MCFSAGADFAAAAGIGAVGVATLAQVRRPRLALFAALPLLFAGHQLTEGFVWLGMDRTISAAATRPFMYAFMLYAQAVLPLLIALAVLLVEPRGWRRAALAALVAVGVGLCAWGTWALAAAPSTVTVEGRCLTFRNPITNHPWTVLVYAGPACAAPLDLVAALGAAVRGAEPVGHGRGAGGQGLRPDLGLVPVRGLRQRDAVLGGAEGGAAVPRPRLDFPARPRDVSDAPEGFRPAGRRMALQPREGRTQRSSL